MLRLAFFPVVLLILAITLALLVFFLYRKIKKGVKVTYRKGAEIATEQQQKWQQKEQRKKLPIIVQKGLQDFEKIKKTAEQLTPEWKNTINPLIEDCQEVLDGLLSEEIISDSRVNSIRTFFNHTLDALKQFIEKINSDYGQMNKQEIEKARENITVLKTDIMHHQKIIHKKRKLDFDVLMDVIKARLKR